MQKTVEERILLRDCHDGFEYPDEDDPFPELSFSLGLSGLGGTLFNTKYTENLNLYTVKCKILCKCYEKVLNKKNKWKSRHCVEGDIGCR